MVALLGACAALAGCDLLLGLDELKPLPTTPPPVVGQNPIAAGYGHTCFVNSDGALFCWGENDLGQLGLDALQYEDDAIAKVGDATWIAIAAGWYHTCGLQTDHSLWCWGYNAVGQLGDGTTTGRNAPVQIGSAMTVATGTLHTCAVTDAGVLSCWGDNTYGQLGDGTMTMHESPSALSGTTWSQVASGAYHTCAIAADATMSCWGNNDGGQLGDGSVTPHPAPAPVKTTETWSQVAAGAQHTCGITTAGHLRCWGYNGYGQLGVGVAESQMEPTAVLIGGVDPDDWVGLAANGEHTCAWNAQQQAYCWGDSSRGELGGDGIAVNMTPMPYPSGSWASIGLGIHHLCALDGNDRLYCVGSRGWGQLGNRGTSQLAPVAASSSTTWAQLSAGTATTCVIDSAGDGSCGGDGQFGQIGTGSRTSYSTLQPVASAVGWNQLAPADEYTCGVNGHNSVACWGDNALGSLGLGSTLDYATSPTGVTLPGSGQANLVVGFEQTCARDSVTYSLACWGPNNTGQLGTTASSTPTFTPGTSFAAPGGEGWASVGAGLGFTCALAGSPVPDSSGAYCWGRNDMNQLGDGSSNEADTPTAVALVQTLGALFTGEYHSCAIDGSTLHMSCWGNNSDGQLGNNTFDPTSSPVAVASSHLWIGGAAGSYHTCAIASDHTLYCWGNNRRGQLGNGDETRMAMATPTQVGSDTDWTAVAAGQYHTCGLRNGGQLYCWGSNDDGALLDGNGWTTELVQVALPP